MLDKLKEQFGNIADLDVFIEKGKTYVNHVPIELLFEDETKTNKHLKGLLFDDLVYRYKNAVEQLAIYEFMMDKEHIKPLNFYQSIARNNLMHYINLLNEAIGDHD